MKRLSLLSLLTRGALAMSLSACAWLSGLTTYEQCPDECVAAPGPTIDAGDAGPDSTGGPSDGGRDGSDGSYLCGAAPCSDVEACCAGGPADGGAIGCSAARACPSPAVAIECIDDSTCRSDYHCCGRINVTEERVSVIGCFEQCDVYLCDAKGTCADTAKTCQSLAPGAPRVCR